MADTPEHFEYSLKDLVAIVAEQRNAALDALAIERAAFANYRKQNPPQPPTE